MTLIIDPVKDIERIILNIKSDSTLFDESDPEGKLQDVIFGNPTQMKNEKGSYIFVTTRSNYQKTSYAYGLSTQDSLNQKTVEYDIVIISYGADDTIESQKFLYSIITKMEALVQNNPSFKDAVQDDDPIFTRSIINSMPWDEKTRGQEYSKITLVLTATIGSNLIVNFPGIGDVFILSQPRGTDGLQFGAKFMGDGERVLTDGGDFGNIYIEYESTFALDDSFRAKYGAVENITFKRGTTSKIFKCVYYDLSPTTEFDGIPRTILHLEITK